MRRQGRQGTLRQGENRGDNKLTGISDPFDEPKCAHLTLDSSGSEGASVDDMVDQLAHLFEKPKAVLLPGRWQPLHVGHEWLIQRELTRARGPLMGIRDTPVSDSDPFSTDVIKRMIEHGYADEDVEAWVMPDIEAISYGRKVGYEVREGRRHSPRDFRCLRNRRKRGQQGKRLTEGHGVHDRRGNLGR